MIYKTPKSQKESGRIAVIKSSSYTLKSRSKFKVKGQAGKIIQFCTRQLLFVRFPPGVGGDFVVTGVRDVPARCPRPNSTA